MDWQDFNSAMAAYSLDLRERIVEAVERQVGSKRKIADLFGVHESFIYKLLRQKRERGDIAPLPHGGGAHAKLSEDHLRQLPDLVAATPDATLDELREQLKKKARVAVSLPGAVPVPYFVRSVRFAEPCWQWVVCDAAPAPARRTG